MKPDQKNASEMTVVFKDDHLLLVNKPPNLLSVPDGYDPDLPHLRSVLANDYGPLWMVHRLDRETSGLLILARTEAAHRELNAQFREREVQKMYHALVTPLPVFQEKTVSLPLLPNADRRHRTRVDQHNGKQAQTYLKVLKRFPLGALMEIQIKTGITHQIRSHLRSLDLCLFGETLYNGGLPPQPLSAARGMLHARQITFKHPASGEDLRFEASYPQDFRELYTKLRFTTAQDEWIL